jgi:hypothetical protein
MIMNRKDLEGNGSDRFVGIILVFDRGRQEALLIVKIAGTYNYH